MAKVASMDVSKYCELLANIVKAKVQYGWGKSKAKIGFSRYFAKTSEQLSQLAQVGNNICEPFELLRCNTASLLQTLQKLRKLFGSIREITIMLLQGDLEQVCKDAKHICTDIQQVFEGTKKGIELLAREDHYAGLLPLYANVGIKYAVDRVVNYLKGCVQGETEKSSAKPIYCEFCVHRDDMVYYQLEDVISVYNGCPTLRRIKSIGASTSKDICPLPSWIKGHLRTFLHKLVYMNILAKMFASCESSVERCMNKLIHVMAAYAALLAVDDESEPNIVIGDNLILNLVSYLVGFGGLESLVTIGLTEEDRQDSRLCCYKLQLNPRVVPYVYTVLLDYLKKRNELAALARLIQTFLNKFDVVLLALILYANREISREDISYRFLPFTAAYMRDTNFRGSNVVLKYIRWDEDQIRSGLEAFYSILDLYAEKFLEAVGDE